MWCGPGYFLLGAVRERVIRDRILWLVPPIVSKSSFDFFLVLLKNKVHLRPNFPFYENVSSIRLELLLIISFYIATFTGKDPVSKYGPILESQQLRFQHMNLGVSQTMIVIKHRYPK
jgi:hypothetical protein